MKNDKEYPELPESGLIRYERIEISLRGYSSHSSGAYWDIIPSNIKGRNFRKWIANDAPYHPKIHLRMKKKKHALHIKIDNLLNVPFENIEVVNKNVTLCFDLPLRFIEVVQKFITNLKSPLVLFHGSAAMRETMDIVGDEKKITVQVKNRVEDIYIFDEYDVIPTYHVRKTVFDRLLTKLNSPEEFLTQGHLTIKKIPISPKEREIILNTFRVLYGMHMVTKITDVVIYNHHLKLISRRHSYDEGFFQLRVGGRVLVIKISEGDQYFDIYSYDHSTVGGMVSENEILLLEHPVPVGDGVD